MIPYLSLSAVFDGRDPAEMALVLENFPAADLAAGRILWRGMGQEQGQVLFILMAGQVDIAALERPDQVVQRLGPGAIFGEYPDQGLGSSGYVCRTAGDCRLYILSQVQAKTFFTRAYLSFM